MLLLLLLGSLVNLPLEFVFLSVESVVVVCCASFDWSSCMKLELESDERRVLVLDELEALMLL